MGHIELVQLAFETEVDGPGPRRVVLNREGQLGIEAIGPLIGHLEFGTVVLEEVSQAFVKTDT